MSNLDLGRMQFAMTSIYHFFFVPLTIGLSFLVAILQTKWHRKRDPEMKRLAKFFGTLLLINIAIGVVTGLVQEFQFGMNWSEYSRFVGDVFGAPLAMEGLAAFFIESTFLGIWIFGWGKIPEKLHLACIWIVAIGASLSALFIIAANSWMQNPVGYELSAETGRPVLNDIGAIFTNPIFIWAYIHVLLASAVTGAVIMLAVSAVQIRRKINVSAFTKSAKVAIVALIPSVILAMGVGSELGVMEAEYQPMKIAASEAQWETCQPCSFSLFQIGGGNDDQNPTRIIQIPYLLSILATNDPNGQVLGLNELQAQYEETYGPGYYIPNVFVQYWSMRVMAYTAGFIAIVGLWGAWLWRRGKLTTSRTFLWVAAFAAITPFIVNTAGWMLTESGRQPWIVQGLMLTEEGVSPSVSATEIWISIITFAILYVIIGIVWARLLIKYARRPLPEDTPDTPTDSSGEKIPTLTY
ncbi:MAG: cytochrome ubiquinol oxidase subunit I [Actinomycetia bacterium]|nr:cytochrome ubiquinol oxidase subunit I [Actinomycetes bacterium]